MSFTDIIAYMYENDNVYEENPFLTAIHFNYILNVTLEIELIL
jgi:isoprenylcysteine carboxyl methyltransferase (ICMT) family protein YpbQ